jgi:hypothetical protein
MSRAKNSGRFRPYSPGIAIVRGCASTRHRKLVFQKARSGHPATNSAMPQYYFRIRNGRYMGASDQGTECADHGEAWKEMTNVCADMATGILRKLRENSEWQLELLDEAREPVFRIRIVAESLE